MNKRTYEAIALSKEFTGGRLFGRISFLGNRLHFTNGDFEKDLSFNGLLITKGGASNGLIFFSNPYNPDLSFYTRDQDVINDPVLNANADISNQLKELMKTRNKSRLLYAAAAVLSGILLCCLVYAFFYIKEHAVKTAAHAIPVEWEEKLGDAAFRQTNLNLIRNDAIDRSLAVITSPLVQEAHKNGRKYNFEFFIARDSSVNAFALPGGKIVIHSGLIMETDAAEELAGVLAHEISHITEQHSMRQLIQTLGIYFLMQTFLGDIEGIIAVLIENSGYLLTLKFSRDFEREADEAGLRILQNAGIHPSGMILFFEKLMQIEHSKNDAAGAEQTETDSENSASAVFESLSTHPDTESRINALKKKITNLKKNEYSKINLDYIRFKKYIEAEIK